MAAGAGEFCVGHYTHKGLIRQANEDSFGYDADLGLFVVADGVGGSVAGSTASQLAVDIVLEEVPERLKNINADHGSVLSASIQTANSLIHKAGESDPSLRGMATTVVCALITGSTASVAHAGDSRLYLYRDSVLYQVTVDHSWVNEMIKAGVLNPQDALYHPNRHMITRFLGGESGVIVDVEKFEIEPGDRLLLCTDGLTEHLADEEIQSKLRLHRDDPGFVCETLVDRVLEEGASDNVTVLLVDCP